MELSRLQSDMIAAMKARDKERKDSISALVSAVKKAAIDAGCREEDYEDLLDRVTVENMTDTRILSITVEDPSPAMAQRIAESIRETAAEHIRNVTDVEAVNVAEAANLPAKPASPSKLIWAVISAAAGFLIVFVILTVRFLSDDTIGSSEDVEKYLGLSTLALIPREEAEEQSPSALKGKRSRRKKTGAGSPGSRGLQAREQRG